MSYDKYDRSLVNPIDRPREHRVQKRNADVEARLDKALSHGSSLSDWERSFLSSLSSSVKRYGSLTGKQESTLQRIENNNNPMVQAARASWREDSMMICVGK